MVDLLQYRPLREGEGERDQRGEDPGFDQAQERHFIQGGLH
jgi:hypothetical protein